MARPRDKNPSPDAIRMREQRARKAAAAAGVKVEDVPRRSNPPGRPPKKSKQPAAQTCAPAVLVKRTPEEAQELLARIGSGEIQADAVQVSALRAMLDSRRRDGGVEEPEDVPWLEDGAAFDKAVAEKFFEQREAGRA